MYSPSFFQQDGTAASVLYQKRARSATLQRSGLLATRRRIEGPALRDFSPPSAASGFQVLRATSRRGSVRPSKHCGRVRTSNTQRLRTFPRCGAGIVERMPKPLARLCGARLHDRRGMSASHDPFKTRVRRCRRLAAISAQPSRSLIGLSSSPVPPHPRTLAPSHPRTFAPSHLPQCSVSRDRNREAAWKSARHSPA
jgi:hypothetical protein